MKLSVFPRAKVLPISKEEKSIESLNVSRPNKAVTKEFTTEDDLIEIVTNFTWSPFVFREYRHEDNFISVDVLAFDIDSGMRIEEAEEIVHKLNVTCICLPSTSFTEDEHRFRLIFPLAKTITDKGVYRATYAKYAEYFNVDPSCKDLARFYFGSTLVDGFYYESDLLEPVPPQKPKNSPKMDYDTRERVEVGESLEELVKALYGEPREKIPESIAYFLENAPDNLSGEWFRSSNAFLFTCGLSGLDRERIKQVFFSLYPYEELTEKKVAKMIEDGYNEREEEL